MAEKKEIEISFDIYQPFGPSILKTKLPQLYIDGLNAQSDSILMDEKASKDRDWSHNLAGNVKKEISIDHMAIEGLPEFLATDIARVYEKSTPRFSSRRDKSIFPCLGC